MYDQFVTYAGSGYERVPGVSQWAAGEELEEKERKVKNDIKHEEAVNYP